MIPRSIRPVSRRLDNLARRALTWENSAPEGGLNTQVRDLSPEW